MRPLSLQLTNVFQHEQLELTFCPGITGVIGRNGSGKSNLLEALYFALTGKTSSGLVKSDLLNWNHDKGSTTLTFEHAGKTFELIRNVHSTSAWLKTEGERDLKNAEVNSFMEDVFGMDFDSLYETCWTPQGGLVAVLTMTHMQRVAFFQRLANIRKAETLRGIIQERGLNRLPALLNRDKEIGELQAAIQRLSAELMASSEALGSLQQIYDEYKAAFPEVQRILGMMDERTYAERLRKAEDALTEAQALRDLAAVEFSATPQVEVAQPPGPDVELQRTKWTQKQQIEKSIVALRTRISSMQSVKDEPVDEPVKLREDFKALKEDIQKREPRYQMAKAKICPTCKRPFQFESETDREGVIALFEAAQKDLHQLAVSLESVERRYLAYTTWKRHNDTQVAVAQQDLNALLKDIVELGDIQFSEAEYKAQQERARVYTQYLQKTQATERKLAALREAANSAAVRVEDARKQVYVKAEDRQKADEFMASYHELEGRIRDTQSKTASTKAMMEGATQQLKMYGNEQALGRDVEKMRNLFERAREILHRDCLPKLVMQKMLAGLNGLLDSYLSVFDTNYTAYIDEELEFICTFESKAGVPARSLSGGQKVALALAFKFALTDLLAASVPVMVLDEPTVWLDEINRPKLAEVLQKARAVTEKGVYVLVATHEQDLFPSFSRVLNVDTE